LRKARFGTLAEKGSEEARSPAARARAAGALCLLSAHIGGDVPPFVVLGGPLPELLAEGRQPVPPHLGTTDVDVLLRAHLMPSEQLAIVEQALQVAGFTDSPRAEGWRWQISIDGLAVMLDFLCDLDSEREGVIAIPGCRKLRANNLRETGYVAGDWTVRELCADLPGLGRMSARVRFAGLEGHLLRRKCVSVRHRGTDKDYYDLAYLLLYNHAGGPREAAQRLLGGGHAGRLRELRSTFLEVRGRFYSDDSPGPRGLLQNLRGRTHLQRMQSVVPARRRRSTTSSKCRLRNDRCRDCGRCRRSVCPHGCSHQPGG